MISSNDYLTLPFVPRVKNVQYSSKTNDAFWTCIMDLALSFKHKRRIDSRRMREISCAELWCAQSAAGRCTCAKASTSTRTRTSSRRSRTTTRLAARGTHICIRAVLVFSSARALSLCALELRIVAAAGLSRCSQMQTSTSAYDE